ncbi:Gfo/Idh/MocA family oxidoreductase [Salinimonas sp. HHU 13199]|uniref:Gfo/Idh/MocA family oxidoreductase n=1 Tax=Salinimonas profundi TaxID=2729140 RepID=A0ABR8LK01_9ALTE|nr:Gfo/Idh/MocA family oxidoreductase [Salinimonas profundi]MBD3585613.1 Gfo/Idh/MocA family oxidoreductase [Salinimonas profundi]
MISTLLVGFGFSAKTFHLPFLLHNDAFTITAVVSSRPDDVKAVLPDAEVFETLAQALKTVSPDLCIITTPNHLHFDQARQCLTAKTHVLVEKPFVLSAADAESLVAQAALVNRSVHVYQNRRFDGDFLTVKKLIDTQRLGNVRRMESRFDRFRPLPRDRWRENAGPGAGIFWDLGPHLLDQAVQLFGLPDAVQANIDTLRDGGQSDDCFDISLFYPQLHVKLGSSAFQAGTTLRFDVQGEKGSYRKFGLDPQEQALRDNNRLDDSDWGKTAPDEHGKLCNESVCEVFETCQGDYRKFYQQLSESVSNGAESPCSGRSVIPVIRLMELAIESSTEKKQISLKK